MGTGKTSTALKYCYNFKEEHSLSVVWKFKCSNIDLLQKSMNELLHQLDKSRNNNINHSQQTDMDTLENEILKQLKTREELPHFHVLLFDDVKDSSKTHVESFSKKCMRLNRIKIIMTTLLVINCVDDDSSDLYVDGLSFDEAANLFQIDPNNENESYKTLTKMLCNNPFAMRIAKTCMTKCNLTFEKMIERCKATQTVNPPLTSLVELLGNLKDRCERSKKSHIFEMLLMLQFLEVEDIPVTLFGTMFDTLQVDEFVHEVNNNSIGFIKGLDDNRVLTVHELALMAINEFTHGELKIELLKKLLRSFFLSLDKDNNNEKDLIRHKALLPHARKVIDCIETLIKKDRTAITGKEFQMHLIFVSDVISYTMSMQLNTDLNS